MTNNRPHGPRYRPEGQPEEGERFGRQMRHAERGQAGDDEEDEGHDEEVNEPCDDGCERFLADLVATREQVLANAKAGRPWWPAVTHLRFEPGVQIEEGLRLDPAVRTEPARGRRRRP